MSTLARVLVLLLAVQAEAADPPLVAADVREVATGGVWRARDGSGTYRAIVTASGSEHVYSIVTLEWLTGAGVAASKRIDELSDAPLFVVTDLSITPIAKERDGALVRVTVTHRYSGEVATAEIRAGAPGEYAIQLPPDTK